MLKVVLPIAGMAMNPLLIILIGIGGGLVSSLLRIGGGVFVTPVLILVGIPPMVAFPSQLYNTVGSSLIGFFHHWRRNSVDLALAWYLFAGGVIGAIIEAYLYQFIVQRSTFTKHFNVMLFVMLLVVGLVMLFFNLRAIHSTGVKKPAVSMKKWMLLLPLHKVFTRSRTEMSIIVPFCIGVVTGMLTTILGGSLSLVITPAVTYLVGRQSEVINGTSRLVVFSIAIVVTLIQGLHHAVGDWTIIFFLLIGSMIGYIISLFIGNRFSQAQLGIAGGIVILLLAFQFLYTLFSQTRTFAPTAKLNLFTLDYLVSLAKLTSDWTEEIIHFAINHPILYSCVGIFFVCALAISFERFAYLVHKKHPSWFKLPKLRK